MHQPGHLGKVPRSSCRASATALGVALTCPHRTPGLLCCLLSEQDFLFQQQHLCRLSPSGPAGWLLGASVPPPVWWGGALTASVLGWFDIPSFSGSDFVITLHYDSSVLGVALHCIAHSFIELCLCFQTVVLEQTLESLLDCKEIKPVNPKGNQPWIFIGRTDADAETPILWSADVMNQLIGKPTFPDAGKDWGQEEKRATENEMVECHHQFSGLELGHTPGGGVGQGSLVCCSPQGCQESDTAW